MAFLWLAFITPRTLNHCLVDFPVKPLQPTSILRTFLEYSQLYNAITVKTLCYSLWSIIDITHFAVISVLHLFVKLYNITQLFFLLSGIHSVCTSAKHPPFLSLSLSLSQTHTQTHTHFAFTMQSHTHTAPQTGVTLPPVGRTMFNCSSALSSVFCRLGIKGEEERERKGSEVEKLAPRRIPNTEGEENTREKSRENQGMCLIVLEADGQTIRQTHSLT